MVAAGLEGGSWEGVEARTGLWHYMQMQQHWQRFGPPVYIAVAGYLGLAGDGSGPSGVKRVNAAEAADDLVAMMGVINGQNG